MLERIIMEVCNQMAEILDLWQLDALKNVLFINFHKTKIVEDKNEIIVSADDSDIKMIEMFVSSKSVSGRRKSTLKQYVAEIMNFRNTIGKNFSEITVMDIRWYLGAAKEKRKNKMTTIRNKLRYLSSFYSFLLNEGLISSNPVAKIESIKVENNYEKPYSVEDMESLRKICTSLRDRAIVEFLYSTGLRVSEMCSLKVGDIDIYRKEFMVIGKGGKQRVVYISDSAYFHLKEYLEWRQDKYGKTIQEISCEPLFVLDRKPYRGMSRNSVEKLCRKLGLKSGVKNTHPHRFRRTFATEMMNRGMKIEELAKLMGHQKIETTLIYCSIAQENVRNSYRKCA